MTQVVVGSSVHSDIVAPGVGEGNVVLADGDTTAIVVDAVPVVEHRVVVNVRRQVGIGWIHGVPKGGVLEVVDDVVPDVSYAARADGVLLDARVPRGGVHAANDVVADVHLGRFGPGLNQDSAVAALADGGLADL